MGSVQSACCVHLQLQTVGGQEVPTLFEESACVQHGQLAGSSSDMCEHSASDRGGQEVPTLFEGSVKQSTCMSSGCGCQEVPTLFEESAWVQCSQPACVYLQLQTGMSSDRRRQEVPTLLEESACVQHSQLAGASSASDCEGHEV